MCYNFPSFVREFPALVLSFKMAAVGYQCLFSGFFSGSVCSSVSQYLFFCLSGPSLSKRKKNLSLLVSVKIFFLSVCLKIFVSQNLFLSVYLSKSFPVSVSVCLSLKIFLCLCLFLSVSQSLSLVVCLSVS